MGSRAHLSLALDLTLRPRVLAHPPSRVARLPDDGPRLQARIMTRSLRGVLAHAGAADGARVRSLRDVRHRCPRSRRISRRSSAVEPAPAAELQTLPSGGCRSR